MKFHEALRNHTRYSIKKLRKPAGSVRGISEDVLYAIESFRNGWVYDIRLEGGEVGRCVNLHLRNGMDGGGLLEELGNEVKKIPRTHLYTKFNQHGKDYIIHV